MLTQKQKELLLFIHHRLQDEGVPPSFDEMKDALDLKCRIALAPWRSSNFRRTRPTMAVNRVCR